MAVTTTPLLLLLPLLVLVKGPQSASAAARPHMLVIMADDMGWNDAGFRNPARHTPNIDKLAREGAVLNYSYMNQVCTPSRAAFLTGVYPFRMGMQNSVMKALENNSLPLNYTLLPERLQALGYKTHMVGKWHLGFCHHNMTPTRRGFDTFYGMYNGLAGYYDHISRWNGYDLTYNQGEDPANWTTAWEGQGKYSTELFTNRSVQIIRDHNILHPLFLFLSYQALHGPLEVPDRYLDYCQSYTNSDAKTHCAMTAAMDEGIGQVMAAMQDKGLDSKLITLFISDNGGPVKLKSSNWPLRGSKITLWEGGTRVVSILHSKKFIPASFTWDGLIHAVDWYPTLLRAARESEPVPDIDGVNNWWRIIQNRTSKRTSFVYNIDDVRNTSALRHNNYKLIVNKPGRPHGWYNPPGEGNDTEPEAPVYPAGDVMLFDIHSDPEERHDLSGEEDKQGIISTMRAMLDGFRPGLLPSPVPDKPEGGKPMYHNESWVSGWCTR